jgi:hypothetical protein
MSPVNPATREAGHNVHVCVISRRENINRPVCYEVTWGVGSDDIVKFPENHMKQTNSDFATCSHVALCV